MERTTGGCIGSTKHDNLIAKLYPQPDSFLVELKTAGVYARGTVLSRESDGTYEVLGAGSGKASVVLADDTLADDTVAVAYRSGHFNTKALIAAADYELTAADENDLRGAGIFLSEALPVRGEETAEAVHVYTEEELTAMTVDQIRALAEELGYTITKSVKAEIIAEFLSAQG